MDNNLAKNRFFSRSIQLNFIREQISLKQIILQQLRNAIAIYRTENSLSHNLDRVLTSLPDKVILQDNSDDSSLVYCAAVAFGLANLWGLPSLQLAQELVSLCGIKIQESTQKFQLQFTAKVVKNGLIEFTLSDRSLGLWLSGIGDRGLGDGEMEEQREQGGQGEQGEIGDYNVFPVQYVHDRCCSLLRLGAREGLIKLKNGGDFSGDTWQIANPNPFKYYCDENIRYFYESAELNLLRKISAMIDFISDRDQAAALRDSNYRNTKTQVQTRAFLTTRFAPQLALNLSDACLKFIAACRIFGSIAQEQRDLAIARLGLIAIVQNCL